MLGVGRPLAPLRFTLQVSAELMRASSKPWPLLPMGISVRPLVMGSATFSRDLHGGLSLASATARSGSSCGISPPGRSGLLLSARGKLFRGQFAGERCDSAGSGEEDPARVDERNMPRSHGRW